MDRHITWQERSEQKHYDSVQKDIKRSNEEKLKQYKGVIEKVTYSIKNSKTDRGAVILGDDLEKEILNIS